MPFHLLANAVFRLFYLQNGGSITSCYHLNCEEKLRELLHILGYAEDSAEGTISQVRGYTDATFCVSASMVEVSQA